MNERIKKLAEQAGLNIPVDTEYNGHIYRHALEKFAKLIVGEVLDVIENEQFEIYEPVVERVKQHFGVE
jgi:hypothetical protein